MDLLTSFEQSTLEFNLRLQEFIELARAGKGMEAIAYAKKYLTPWQSTEFKRIQQAMTLLIFKSDTKCQPYKVCRPRGDREKEWLTEDFIYCRRTFTTLPDGPN